MEIKGPGYCISTDPTAATIYFQGTFRLEAQEYRPIMSLLEQFFEQEPALLTLNLQQLEFINSSGFTSLARFITHAKTQKKTQVLILASSKVDWHRKSLNNLKRLMPLLQIEFH